MEKDSHLSLSSIKVDGGASKNNFLMQFESDIIGVPVNRPACIETTAMGAAYLAGLCTGFWKNKEDVKENQSIERVFTPMMSEEAREKELTMWHKAVKYAGGWSRES